ncbi:hypothetical protein HYFRA_00012497 [Hymenoscyphus fraxineus]|uniref:Heterokaryon incompatibility domain-containing protein n=1 Tax=Hymenoscyphus fraxineus TaxID=746836 RepID=A0A9N9L3Q7_9HELO|nr:hypothetical protein HYFRA_00012497 [Hymenoscyphus fraxineus]
MAGFSSGNPGREKAKGVPVDVAFEFFGKEEDPITSALRISRRPLEEYPLSPANVEKIQRWMKDCDENHEKCLKDIQRDYLPTRLLDVGTLQYENDPKLILSAEAFPDHGRKPIYMALSYCWGAPEDLRGLLTTTRETLSARRAGIEITSMPQTFQDAVRTARALGIRYLWIDSLCIIQDNEDDWKVESGRMAETFSTAYLTVIAASSDSCHEGFLHRRERPSCSVPVVLTNPMSTSTPGSPSIQGTFSLRYRHHHWGSDKMAEIKQGRWISRGWTFQEERLARRALIFGEGKFFLDCRTLERTEDTALYKHRPDWVETVRESGCEEERAIEPGALKRSNTGSAYLHRRTPYDHWRTLCNHYSRRTLTYEKDKLPAISGMARQILKKKEMRGSAYLAGLWRENLLHDLFWQPVEGARKAAVYRAPSWSWAAIEGHISWPVWRYCVEGECEIYCEVVDAWTRTDSLDPFGGVTGGSLRICGVVREVEMLCVRGESVSKQGPWSLTCEGELVATGRLDIAIPGELGNGRYWALLIAKCKVKEGRPAVPRGLLLEKRVCDDGTEEFERVGIFKILADDKEGRSPLEAWQSLGKQTITII